MTISSARWLAVCAMCLALAVAGSDLGAQQDGPLLQGLVRAEGTGAPLAGARVEASRGGTVVGRAVSGQNGRFEMPVTGSGEIEVTVRKAGYAPYRLSPAAVQPLDVRLIPGAVITGHVFDTTGLPVPDFSVRVRRAGADGAAPGPWMTTATNDLGEYRLGSLPEGSYEVGVHPASMILAPLGQLGATGINPGRALPLQLLAGLPDLVPGLPPPVVVELRAGRETLHSLSQPDTSPGVRQSPAATAAGMTAGLETVRRQLGAPPVDPNTAGRINGVVMTADRRPVPGMVRLQPQDGSFPHMTLADGTGRYEFQAVPPGAYRVIAQGGGMMEAEYGANRSARAGAWVTVRERQRVEGIDIELPRAGVASGRIVDAFGEPLEGLTVEAWQAQTYAGRSVLVPAVQVSSGTTDDRGHYRLHGFMPGRYYIVAAEPAAPAPAGFGAGGPEQALRMAMTSATAMMSTPPRPHAYYPGHPTLQDALPIIVDVGIDALGLDMAFTPAQGVLVSGVVLGPDGAPLSAEVTLSVSARSGAPLLPPYRTPTAADGTFSFPWVVPGDYVLQAEAQRPGGLIASTIAATGAGMGGVVPSLSVSAGGTTSDLMSLFGGAPWTADNVPPFATTFVAVTGTSVPPVTLRATTGSSLSGRLTFEGPGEPPAPSAFAIGFAAADTDAARGLVPAARVADDGTFAAFGLVGPMRMIASRTPEGWWLKSVTIDGVNAVDQPVTFGGAASQRQNVDVVFSSARSGVAGRVRTRAGESAAAAAVLVFPTDWTRWHAGTPYVRRAAATNGRFELTALAPGTYFVVAVDAADATAVMETQNPDQLNRLLPLAQQVSVREGSVQNVELTLADLPR